MSPEMSLETVDLALDCSSHGVRIPLLRNPLE